MRPSPSIKTLFRTPFKTLVTFILLAAVTFAFFSRVAEYSITNREIKNAAKEYRGVGSAEIAPALESYPEAPFYISADPHMSRDYSEEEREYYINHFRYQPLSQEQISSILELPYVSSSSTRYMTPGVSDRYYRIDEGNDYYNYTARFIIEGTLSEVEYGINYHEGNFNDLILDDCTLLAGNPPWLTENKKITIHAYSNKLKQGTSREFGGSRIRITYDDSYIYDTEYVKKLAIGNRYVIIGRFEPLNETPMLFLSDHLTNPWCEAVQSVEGQPRNYLEIEQFAPLRELINMTNTDLHTFDIVYTDDMSAIMRFAEGDMVVKSGRRLTKEDSINKSNVCVVSRDFASKNSLNLGDKITLKLGTEMFEQYKGLGAVAAARERYSPPDRTVELEIVGIYMDTDGKKNQLRKPNWSYSINTVFVPKSLLPLDESKLGDHVFSPSEFSFTVDDAWNIPSFIEKAAPAFKKMGLTLIFDDDGWPDIVDEFKMSKKLSVIAILALSAAVIAATGFIVFLFIGRKKKEYAIMRALGTTRKESAKALILPLMGVSVFAVLAGSCTAWIHTTNTIAETNNALAKIEEYVVNTSIPVTAAIGCILGEILLVLLFALFGLWRIGTIPPLMLLQDNQNKQIHSKKQAHSNKQMKGNRKPTYVETKAYAESAALSGILVSNIPAIGKKSYASDFRIPDAPILNAPISGAPYTVRKANIKSTCGHILRYIAKHIYRSAGKSILAILLSVLLTGAVGQFAVMRQSYVNLCRNIEMKAKFINGLHLITVAEIEETGYVINPYYEYTHYAVVNNSTDETDWAVTNDIDRYTGEKAEITYAEGYNEANMKKLGNVCIVGSQLLKEYGLKPGEKIHVTMYGTLKNLQNFYVDKYRGAHKGEKISDEKILELYNVEILKKYMNEGSYYTIAGFITTPSGKYDKMIFSPGTLNTKPIFGFDAPLDLAEFTLADNLQVNEFRSYAEGKVGGNNLSNGLTFLMDTSKIDNLLNTVTLLEKLFPVVVMAAMLIGGLVCGLIIIQGAKEAAILRVLGTTRQRTCVIMVIEEVFLCITGLSAGVCGLILYNGASLAEIASKLYIFTALYFAGCFTGTIICSLITTNHKVLELLQTKE